MPPALDRAASRPTTGTNSASSSPRPSRKPTSCCARSCSSGSRPRPRPRDRRARAHPAAQGRPLRRAAACAASSSSDAAAAADDRRRLPLGIRRAIVELKAEYPPFGLREIAAHLPAPLRPPGQPPHRRAGAGHRAAAAPPAAALPALPRDRRSGRAPARRSSTLYLEGLERQGDRRLPGDLPAHGLRDAAALGRRRAGRGWPTARRAPHHPARKVDLKAMAAIRRLQANPELGEFRIHAALAQQGIHLCPRTCGRILALHRALGAPQPAAAMPARAAADAVRRPAAAPVLVGRRPLHRGPPARHRQAGLRHLDPGELQPGAAGQRDLAAPGPDRLPDRAAGGGRGPRRAGGPRQRRRRHLQGQAARRRSTPRSASARSRSTPGRPGRTTSRPTSTSCAAWPTTTTPGPRPGPSCRPSTTASSTTTTTSRTSPTATGPTGGQPGAVLGWVQGAGATRPTSTGSSACATRRLNAGGSVRFRHWRLYGERGLAGERAAVWVWDETLTIEYATETLAQYRVAFEPTGAGSARSASPGSSRPATPRPSRSCRRWRRSSGTRRSGWRPTGRAARGRHRQRKRGSLRRDTTRLAGVAGPRRPSQCLLAGIIDRHLTPLPPRRIIPDDRFT